MESKPSNKCESTEEPMVLADCSSPLGNENPANFCIENHLDSNNVDDTLDMTRQRLTANDCNSDDAEAVPTAKPRVEDSKVESKRQSKHKSLTPQPAANLSATIRHGFDDLASRAKDGADRLLHVWRRGWLLTEHRSLPDWLKDNDFLVEGHRPQLGSFTKCFQSIFRVHTETGNIWTHMLGCIAFTAMAIYFLSRPAAQVQVQDKLVFSAFFLGAILCMGLSFLFHTVYCHSERIGRLFNKLDYCGIALLTMGSFVPWLYYGFYCQVAAKVVYISLIGALGTAAIVVSMFDAFAAPKFRALRAGVFILLGASGAIPALHYTIVEGFHSAVYHAGLGWLSLMALLYITGAVIYAVRFPERLFPGKFDFWLQSHQIFHVFVVAAAFVHFHGITQVANYRLTYGYCQ